jgi:ankyrin repeat protein
MGPGAVRRLLASKDDDGLTPLHLACAAGQTGTAQFLLRCGSDPRTVDWLACTPLHSAAEHGHVGTALYQPDEVRKWGGG